MNRCESCPAKLVMGECVGATMLSSSESDLDKSNTAVKKLSGDQQEK